jgi:hypothetical protein
MRRTVIAALATLVLGIGLISPPAAQAASNAYVVKGHPVSAQPGISEATYLCYDGAPDGAVTRLERDGGTVGTSALGWQKTPAGAALGPRVVLAGDPTTLNTFRVDVLAPSGTTGWVHVYFEDNGDGTEFVQNDGWAQVTLPASGSWQTLDVTNRTYTWDWWIDGVYQGQPTDTVQGFAGDSGAIAQATFDVLLGCNGQPFHLDGLAVRHAAHQVSYDFEKKVTDPVCHVGHVMPGCPDTVGHLKSHMEWSADGTTVQTGNAVTIRYGQSLWMLGHSHVHYADGTNSWYSGIGTLWQTPAKGDPSVALRGAFDPSKYAALKVAPKRNTIYTFAVDAHAPHPATTSNPLSVFVESRVKAKVLDKKLVEGQRLAVKGKILPAAKKVKVSLQRKTGDGWKTVVSSKTEKGGWFDLSTRARKVGKWKVRLQVDSTGTNVGTTTKTVKVVVKKYVPPPKAPSQPPPQQPDPTPEAANAITLPPPPPPPDDAPKPPPRPTNTGRIAAADTVAGGVEGRVGTGIPKGEARTKR